MSNSNIILPPGIDGRTRLTPQEQLKKALEVLAYELTVVIGLAREIVVSPDYKEITIFPRFLFKDMVDHLNAELDEPIPEKDYELIGLSINISKLDLARNPHAMLQIIHSAMQYFIGLQSGRELIWEKITNTERKDGQEQPPGSNLVGPAN